ncbi:MAG TPA: preprotein translocase subunit YajC [Friedmanniella sp.]
MPQQYSTLVLVLLMVVAFYFLILRPQRKRQQALQKMTRELQPGDQVLLGSGLFGTLVSLGTKQAVMEIAPGVELTVLKQAIVRRATEADVDAVSEDEVGDELEAEATATYDSGDPQPVVRADPSAPDVLPTIPPLSVPTYPSSTDTDRSNLR